MRDGTVVGDNLRTNMSIRWFNQFYRHYRRIEPAATAAYIAAYRQMWDSDAGQS